MTQEDKKLSFIDISGRLPYEVKIHIDFNENGHIVGDATLNTITSITGQFFNFTDFKQDFKNGDCCPISGFGSNRLLRLGEFKPYLRPMSSMTEKEIHEISKKLNYEFYIDDEGALCAEDDRHRVRIDLIEIYIEWLNEHHFDYRGLIPMELALEAPEGMYNTKTE